jgi:hypothetical protein
MICLYEGVSRLDCSGVDRDASVGKDVIKAARTVSTSRGAPRNYGVLRVGRTEGVAQRKWAREQINHRCGSLSQKGRHGVERGVSDFIQISQHYQLCRQGGSLCSHAADSSQQYPPVG